MKQNVPCRSFEGVVPPHFYGEMVKTEYGCQILQDKGYLTDFIHFIRAHAMESEDYEIIQKLKSVLWAVVCTRLYFMFPLLTLNAGKYCCH